MKLNIKKLIKILSLLLIIGSHIYIFINSLQHPELTLMQIFKLFWWLYLIQILMITLWVYWIYRKK